MDVLDAATLETLRSLQDDGDDDLVADLIDLFFQDAPARVAGMHAAIVREDWPALASCAHSLKGSCGSLGALQLAQLCARLEQVGRAAGPRAVAEAMYHEIEEHYELVCAALQRERNAVMPTIMPDGGSPKRM
jgi:HPt (histidine-containing phosphotransfer) domain-containing protein